MAHHATPLPSWGLHDLSVKDIQILELDHLFGPSLEPQTTLHMTLFLYELRL
jgi:hypothetical protein